MQNRFLLSTTIAIMAVASVHSADARARRSSMAVRSSAPITACGAALLSAELRDGHGSCARRGTARARVRVGRASRGRERHAARRGASCGGALSTVRASSGAIACVASAAASAMQGFVSALEATGYRIDFMGGWRAHGSCGRCDMHPRGLAIDINQTGRNRVTRSFPPGVTALAARYGLLHGAVWKHADTGHFELLSASPTRYAHKDVFSAYASATPAHRRNGRRRAGALAALHAPSLTEGAAMQGSGY
jgi:hypothetical protein